MQGAFAKKKTEQHPLAPVHAPSVSPFDSSVHMSEKKAPAGRPMSPSMSEGPMMLSEGSRIEAAGRASFEKSVKIEIAAMNMRRKKKAPEKGKGKKRKGDEKPPKK